MSNKFEQKNVTGDNKTIFVSKGDFVDQSKQIRNSFKDRSRNLLISNIIAGLGVLIALLTFIFK